MLPRVLARNLPKKPTIFAGLHGSETRVDIERTESNQGALKQCKCTVGSHLVFKGALVTLLSQ